MGFAGQRVGMSNIKKSILTFLVLVSLVLLPFGLITAYQITQFPAGKDTYTLSEPIVDWLVFKGKSMPVIQEDDFILLIFEGSSPDESNWVTIAMLGDKETNKLIVIAISIHEGVTSGDPSKMKTTNFYHKTFLETGKPDFKMVRMEKEPYIKKFIDEKRLKSRIKKQSI